MAKLTIYSPCYYADKSKAAGLIYSARKKRLKVVFYGMGQPYDSSVRCKWGGLLEAMDKCQTPYAMILDANDTFLLCGEEELLTKYKGIVSEDGALLGGAGQHCWPLFKCQTYFDRKARKQNGLWSGFRYPNAGTVMGGSQKLRQMADTLVKNASKYSLHVLKTYDRGYEKHTKMRLGSDQGVLIFATHAGKVALTLDRKCEVFLNTVHVPLGHLKVDSRIAYLPFGVEPCILHANGQTVGLMRKKEKLFASLSPGSSG